MFDWKKNYKWIFSELGAADKVGVNDAGIGIFKRQPYKGLAKEILQNVTDAKDDRLPEDVPVRARFELVYVDRDDIPDYQRLNEVIHKCYEYYHDGDDGAKLKVICDASEKYLEQEGKIPVLKISDFNTYGLRGVHEEKGSNWTGLVRERSATNKSNGSSGAFGVGKFAPYNFSALRTVLYSTKTREGETAFQGKAILTTFSEFDEDKQKNVVKQNIGLFADTDTDNFDAVFSVNDIAPVFRRDVVGTDLFVIGFEKEEDWIEQSAISVIEYFFYSIYRGKLNVEIVEGDKVVEINKSSDSLKELSCDFTGNLINITLPTEQFEDYKNCGYNKKKYKMLNAILSIPVVVEAIGIISNDENNPDEKSGLEGKSWYKTIVANLKRYAENDDNKYKKLLGKPFTAAEILLGNNFIAALSYLNDLD